jgi:hypothetical protein
MSLPWSTPRKTPMAGRRKATQRFCNHCDSWHDTHRALGGRNAGDECYPTPFKRPDAPHIRRGNR